MVSHLDLFSQQSHKSAPTNALEWDRLSIADIAVENKTKSEYVSTALGCHSE